jgi:hypothetical protein
MTHSPGLPQDARSTHNRASLQASIHVPNAAGAEETTPAKTSSGLVELIYRLNRCLRAHTSQSTKAVMGTPRPIPTFPYHTKKVPDSQYRKGREPACAVRLVHNYCAAGGLQRGERRTRRRPLQRVGRPPRSRRANRAALRVGVRTVPYGFPEALPSAFGPFSSPKLDFSHFLPSFGACLPETASQAALRGRFYTLDSTSAVAYNFR